ncbi:MAG: hypothetical protein M3257_04605 [Actinomycetota bacterium]|nr:hypothetical protein [Actinomycetota bacterium]
MYHPSPGEIARRFWRRLADPAMWPHERLFFEMYGRALQRDPCAAPLLDGLVESWLAPLTEWNRRQGIRSRPLEPTLESSATRWSSAASSCGHGTCEIPLRITRHPWGRMECYLRKGVA